MKIKGLVLLLLLIFLVPAVAGCSNPAGSGSSKAEDLKLGLIPVEDNFPFFVAEKEGLFTKAGLKVELVPFNSARDRDLALQSGSIDGEVADIVATALLRKGGTPVKIASLTMGATPAEGRFALLAGPGANISSPGQLQGRTVGISENTIIEYVADGLLREGGVDPAAVQKLPVPQIPERLQLLLGGRLDAALLPDPFASLAAQKGARVILDDTQIKRNLSQVVLIFREEALQQKKPAIKKLLQVYTEAANLITRNPSAYRELFIEKARIPAELKDTYLAPHYSPPQLPRREEVAAVMDWMVAKKLLAAPYKYEELVDPDLVNPGGNNR
ncbi:ABC transporter substrate-binding protein [Moorella sp. Hama-1]|uniref:ABC transporter substrate-binding protein n=1 Tax=Moorella sp. Hama-1 TaxID=2138101 RepID=UPI000D64826C|nr:MetQ/NlpA family ABC transporter substrate-binding protein [Moorella sp. Hama-1]MDN5361135.1 NitT/TauT family transport system substrate-binding protein [Moorella sp. (in: firmicutes)]BCV20045.1 metal ABC transporter substrate-binding protein [Moorella sp. Hama-1]